MYTEALGTLNGVTPPFISPMTTRMSWFVYVITLDRDLDRDRVVADLAGAGIETRAYFRPIHVQPYFVERFGELRGSLPITEDVGRRTLAIPFRGRLSAESVGCVVEELARAIARQG